MAARVLEEVSLFCSDFSLEKISEIEDFEDGGVSALGQESSESWSNLMSSPENFGPELALDIAISELDSALKSYNDFRVMEIIWFLSLSDLIEPPLGDAVTDSDTFYTGLVKTSVSTALFCNQMQGCQGNHPLTLRICMVLPGRNCFQPNDFYHAVEQTHTGMEIIAFRHLLGQIHSLLFRYRRNNY